jgi:hypothetical protein
MEVNGAVPASAGTVTFTGIGSIALLGSVFISDARNPIGKPNLRELNLPEIQIL